MRRRQKRKNSVQQLMGIQTFTPYGLKTTSGEILFYQISPTNISVLSYESIRSKIEHLITLLQAFPDLEINCSDSTEQFDVNKLFLRQRLEKEESPSVRKLLQRDMEYLSDIQVEMATARQFFFSIHVKNGNEKQIFDMNNRIIKTINEQGFDGRCLSKDGIKRMLAIYFQASMFGEKLPDCDGLQYIDPSDSPAGEVTVC